MTTPEQEAKVDWRYEVRGSSLYDLTEQRQISIFETGEILNAHQKLLISTGVWAAKAGLAEATIAALRTALVESDSMLSLLRHRHIDWRKPDANRPDVGEVDAVIGRSRAALGREG